MRLKKRSLRMASSLIELLARQQTLMSKLIHDKNIRAMLNNPDIELDNQILLTELRLKDVTKEITKRKEG